MNEVIAAALVWIAANSGYQVTEPACFLVELSAADIASAAVGRNMDEGTIAIYSCRDQTLVEDGASCPRAWAEGYARLDADQPPAGVSARRWLQFIDDVGRFLDQGWAERAAALGWGPYDLFGCDAERPLARIDAAGLLLLLNGRRLVAFTDDRAVIELPTGARHMYYRTAAPASSVLAWELAHQCR